MDAGCNGLRFSTDLLPARDRLPEFREVFGKSVVNVDVMPLTGRALRETAILRVIENLRMVLWDTNGHAARRPRALLADSNDDLLLPMILSGVSRLSHL